MRTGIDWLRMERLPDFGSLRVRWLWGLTLSLGVFAFLAIATLHMEEKRHFEELQLSRAEAIARSTSAWVNGDMHEDLASKHGGDAFADWTQVPTELVSLSDFLRLTASRNGLESSIRTMRVKTTHRSAVVGAPDQVHPRAMEIIASAQDDPTWKRAVDYRPEMGAALFDKESAGVAGAENVFAYAPVLNSWGEPVGVTEVTLRANPSFFSILSKVFSWSLLAVLIGFLGLKGIDIFIRRHCLALDQLGLETRRLCSGDRSAAVWRATSARELLRIADALEEWRSSEDPARNWAPRAPDPAGARVDLGAAAGPATAGAPQAPAAHGGAGEKVRALGRLAKNVAKRSKPLQFDLSVLIEQAIQAVRKQAGLRHTDLRVGQAEKLPTQLQGDPEALLTVLVTLLENAVKRTQDGTVSLRVGRGQEGYQLRFEVVDSGVGIPWQEQPKLDESISRAAGRNPKEIEGSLLKASAYVSKMGGQMGFESQPGAGSRFWFTAAFRAGQSAAASTPRHALSR